jgi:hypothetical protein
MSNVFQLTNSNQNLIKIKTLYKSNHQAQTPKMKPKTKFNATHFATHVHTLHAHFMKLGPNGPTHKDYIDSLDLCYLLSFSHINIVCFKSV